MTSASISGTEHDGGSVARIRYATIATEMGRLLVGATGRGVCAVTLGDDDAQLERALGAEYPRASHDRIELGDESAPDAGSDAHDDLRAWVRAVAEHVAGAGREPAVPLDVVGTEFQQRVWQALQAIPYGETRSYSEVADAIGAPRAVRAVARACAGNRVALVVPCHRVVREGGALGGYRWGIERKRRLLARERGVTAHRAWEDHGAGLAAAELSGTFGGRDGA